MDEHEARCLGQRKSIRALFARLKTQKHCFSSRAQKAFSLYAYMISRLISHVVGRLPDHNLESRMPEK